MEYRIKDDERVRRSSRYPEAGNKFPKPNDNFPGQTEFSVLMCDSGNKVRLKSLVSQTLHILFKDEKLQTLELVNIMPV